MLRRVLAGMTVYPDSNVLVGFDGADDGAVYRLDDETALVQSVDFFTPVVDDPFVYGQISAANALSDIYAMGGVPRLALSIVGFPDEELEEDILKAILRGGSEKMSEAQVAVVGGHSVRDPELKFGYCVTGLVHPDRFFTNAGAREDDGLILTKPLGSGIISTGIKYGKTPEGVAQQATDWMLKLNAGAMAEARHFSVNAVTDITGFGLLGHAYEMASASGKTITLWPSRVPLMDGVESLVAQGMLPAGIEANRRYVEKAADWSGLSGASQQIFLDPQTSGGLLISLPQEQVESLSERLLEKGMMGRQIGRVGPPGRQRLAFSEITASH